MVQRGERIMIVKSLKGGRKKRKKDCSRGKREEQKKERKMVKVRKEEERKRKKKDCPMVRNEETKKGCPRKDIP